MTTWAPVAVGGLLACVLASGTTAVLAGNVVPSTIHHDVRVKVDVTGRVVVDADLEQFKPGLLIPPQVLLQGIPDSVEVDLPRSVKIEVPITAPTDHTVTCTGCPK